MTASDAFKAYQSAETVWQASLVAAYGADAGDARYQVRGSMVEGYAEYCKAREAWHIAVFAELPILKLTPAASYTCRAESAEGVVDSWYPLHSFVERVAALDAERDDADFAFYTEDCA